MKIGIIGAGFTGLAASYYLAKKGHDVTVFEKEEKPGGLAIGFKGGRWRWPLEKHYHHIFVSDRAIRNLAREVGHKIIFRKPITSIYINGINYRFDSPSSLLGFEKLSLLERIRVGLILFYLKIIPFWKPLEKITAKKFIRRTMGERAWGLLWEPLFEKKFGSYSEQVPASWFWARIKKRSASLGYPQGGFESLAKNIENAARKVGAKFFYNQEITRIFKKGKDVTIGLKAGEGFAFDRVICTLPSNLLVKLTRGLPARYKKALLNLKGLGAVNLVISLKRKFLQDGTYWLNVNEKDFPFIGIMEQTNFMSRNVYGGEHILYVGNYLAQNHPYFSKDVTSIFQEFFPYLKKINKGFEKSWVKRLYLFKAPFAQPVIPLNYSRILPSLKTPIEGVFLANIQQVYPWDRGTNYAVELGKKVSVILSK